jgi:Tfp pilus assembly protein PilO
MKDFQKRLLIRLGSAILVSAILLGVVLFIGGDIEEVHSSIKSTRSAIATRSQSISTLSDFRKDAEEAEKAASVLENVLPARESLYVFTDEVSRLARARSLTVVSSFGSEVMGTATTPGKIEFTINVSGEYDRIVDFIKVFESSRYFTSMKSFDLVSQGANTTGYQAIMTGDVFYKS